jgi:hypothetical protein
VRDDYVELELDFPLLDILKNLHTVSACADIHGGLSVGFEYKSFPGKPVHSSLFSLPPIF